MLVRSSSITVMMPSIYRETRILSKKLHQNYIMHYWTLILESTTSSATLKNWEHLGRQLECLMISLLFRVNWIIQIKVHSCIAILALKSQPRSQRLLSWQLKSATLKSATFSSGRAFKLSRRKTLGSRLLKSQMTMGRIITSSRILKTQLRECISKSLSFILSSRFCITMFTEGRKIRHSTSWTQLKFTKNLKAESWSHPLIDAEFASVTIQWNGT